MSNQAVYHVAYVATWEEELPQNDQVEQHVEHVEVKTDIRHTMMKKPFTVDDVIDQAHEEMGVKEIGTFILIGITEFDDEYDYNQFFNILEKKG